MRIPPKNWGLAFTALGGSLMTPCGFSSVAGASNVWITGGMIAGFYVAAFGMFLSTLFTNVEASSLAIQPPAIMKKAIVALLLATSMTIMLTGCLLFNKNTPVEQRAKYAHDLGYKITDDAVPLLLAARPNDRALIEKANQILGDELTTTNFSSVNIQKFLNALGVRELHGKNGQLITTGGLILFDLITGGGIDLGTNAAPVIVKAGGWGLHDGTAHALGH